MKYASEWDERVCGMADGPGYGDVEAPTGWFDSVDLSKADDGTDIVEHYGTQYLIVHQSNEGFCTVLPFAERVDRDLRMRQLEQAYDLWACEVTPAQVREAIDAYYGAVMHTTMTDDGYRSDTLIERPQISESSQRQAIDDVTGFIIDNAYLIKDFLSATGFPYAQVGIDFWFSRTWQLVNFSTRGADAGVGLHDAVSAWPTRTSALVDGIIEIS